MKSKYVVRPAVFSDVKDIASHVREPDAAELWASFHLAPYEAISSALRVSRDTSFTGTADGEPVCIFGVKPPSTLSNMAVPWMVASSKLEFHSRVFLRKSRKMVKLLGAQFPYMVNYVDARNVVAIRWLQWVGFSVYYPTPYGADQLPFHRFDMRS